MIGTSKYFPSKTWLKVVSDLISTDNTALTDSYRAQVAAWTQKLHIIETFNGSYFFDLPGSTQSTGAVTGASFDTSQTGTLGTQIAMLNISYTQQQLDLLQQSYDAIKSSVYDALALQTRFKPVLD